MTPYTIEESEDIISKYEKYYLAVFHPATAYTGSTYYTGLYTFGGHDWSRRMIQQKLIEATEYIKFLKESKKRLQDIVG